MVHLQMIFPARNPPFTMGFSIAMLNNQRLIINIVFFGGFVKHDSYSKSDRGMYNMYKFTSLNFIKWIFMTCFFCSILINKTKCSVTWCLLKLHVHNFYPRSNLKGFSRHSLHSIVASICLGQVSRPASPSYMRRWRRRRCFSAMKTRAARRCWCGYTSMRWPPSRYHGGDVLIGTGRIWEDGG